MLEYGLRRARSGAEMIEDLMPYLNDGYYVDIGAHSAHSEPGFYCACYRESDIEYFCDECDKPILEWGKCGHGETVGEAVNAMVEILSQVPDEI